MLNFLRGLLCKHDWEDLPVGAEFDRLFPPFLPQWRCKRCGKRAWQVNGRQHFLETGEGAVHYERYLRQVRADMPSHFRMYTALDRYIREHYGA